MEIGVIGINEFAKEFCQHWIGQGHKILLAGLYAESFVLAKMIAPEVTPVLPEQIGRQAEIIVLAVQPHHLQIALEKLGEVEKKIIIDLILEKPIDGKAFYPVAEGTFVTIQSLLPEAIVVKIIPEYPDPLSLSEMLYAYTHDHLAQRLIRWLMEGSGYQIIHLQHD